MMNLERRYAKDSADGLFRLGSSGSVEEARIVEALVGLSEQIGGMNSKAGPREQNRRHSLGGRGAYYGATGVGLD